MDLFCNKIALTLDLCCTECANLTRGNIILIASAVRFCTAAAHPPPPPANAECYRPASVQFVSGLNIRGTFVISDVHPHHHHQQQQIGTYDWGLAFWRLQRSIAACSSTYKCNSRLHRSHRPLTSLTVLGVWERYFFNANNALRYNITGTEPPVTLGFGCGVREVFLNNLLFVFCEFFSTSVLHSHERINWRAPFTRRNEHDVKANNEL